MSHSPLFLSNISVVYPSKICFEDFSATVYTGDRIALIGRNGSGKTSLLKILAGFPDMSSAFVPQLIDGDALSGGQRFNAALTKALSLKPDVLLLDEPTNHLDRSNRRSLMRMIQHFDGTVIVVSHDVELLRTCMKTFWHFDQGEIYVFTGHYDDYRKDVLQKRHALEAALVQVDRQKKQTHKALMQEQERASKSRKRGEKKREEGKWSTLAAGAKERQAEKTTGKNKAAISELKENLMDRLSVLRLPEVIVPRFSLPGIDSSTKTLVEVRDGSCGYSEHTVFTGISFIMDGNDRVAITGDNGSGKSTLVKAIAARSDIWRKGTWFVPKIDDIGYLDQHYNTLNGDTVLDVVHNAVPNWSHAEIRKYLNDFLFRTNEEVYAKISTLSGGEKVRLSLALIAAKTPKLLILDEITNNVDLETRDHILQVLREYPGAMLLISHDQDFLNELSVTPYTITDIQKS